MQNINEPKNCESNALMGVHELGISKIHKWQEDNSVTTPLDRIVQTLEIKNPNKTTKSSNKQHK